MNGWLKYSRRQGPPDPRERTCWRIWIAAGEVVSVCALLQWIVLSQGSTVSEVVEGIQIAAVLLSVGGLLRWAKLYGG